MKSLKLLIKGATITDWLELVLGTATFASGIILIAFYSQLFLGFLLLAVSMSIPVVLYFTKE